MNIDELIQSALCKGQTLKSLDPSAPLSFPDQSTDIRTSIVNPNPPPTLPLFLSPFLFRLRTEIIAK